MRLWLLALLLTGCATEADRACPAIRATGVAAPNEPGAACTDGTTACPAGMLCHNGVCTIRCERSSECSVMLRGTCFIRTGSCVQTCESDGDCATGTRCYDSPPGEWFVCDARRACYPRRFCVKVQCD